MARTENRRRPYICKISGLWWKIYPLVLLLWISSVYCQHSAVPCVNVTGYAQRCEPEFENAAFELDVVASNTCGEYERKKYCRQTGATGVTKQCSWCSSQFRAEAHPPSFLTDIHIEENTTWWQSETMYEGVQYPNTVNLTLSLGKSFEITYIRLKFYSPRPESFAIYKRTTQDGPWIPYQYYSGSCEATYEVDTDEIIFESDETKALCTSMFSDISPLTGGNIAFSTLEQRPSAYNFDESDVLQDFVTATDILIMLSRLNTFGDEVFRVPDVMRSYYYAISDFSIGGRCKCNGHASSCVARNGVYRLVCECEHHTDGPDCERCLPFYNDKPWARGTGQAIHDCRPCDCNLKSETCYFDQEMYDATGHGGHCVDCREHTTGRNCERCDTNYFRNRDNDCEACNCNPTGSLTLQCDYRGICDCKDGVGGDKCDACLPNFYDFDVTGCRSCDCHVAGSLDNTPECDSDTGACVCKKNLEGKKCERCKPGYFNLQESDKFGCLACFCYGHSSECTSAPGFEVSFIEDDFTSGLSGWKVEYSDGRVDDPVYNALRRYIGVGDANSTGIYFVAPEKYLGDQRSSYGRSFSFQLRIGSRDHVVSVKDFILEGDGITIYSPIVAQFNPAPGPDIQRYTFSLRDERKLGWVQFPTALMFQRVLSNLTAIKIKGTYSIGGQGALDNVQLETVQRASRAASEQTTSVELCSCPDGYVGQFCESCAAGYRRDPPGGGPFAVCLPCECNGHSDICDLDSGVCICQHNTYGDNCQRCIPGYYGNALDGTPYDCEPCPCPGRSECIEEDEIICINCPQGYVGSRCEFCADGFFGDPTGEVGPPTGCQRCDCNGNIDPNAVGNCNRTNGECLKCIYNTGSFYCEECELGFFGDALANPKGQCESCDCYPPGSTSFICDQRNGNCDCLPFIEERNCNTCFDRYWNIDSAQGCEPCECSMIGSLSQSCEDESGECECKPGVGGQQCDECLFDYHGFSEEGCTACNCSPQGSISLNCTYDGICTCQEGVIGKKCDSCEENFYNIALGCVECPVCYNLVQDKVVEHRKKLDELRYVVDTMEDPNVDCVNDTSFEMQLKAIEANIDVAVVEAKKALKNDWKMLNDMNNMEMMYQVLMDQVRDIRNSYKNTDDNRAKSAEELVETFEIIERAKLMLVEAQMFLNEALDNMPTHNPTDQERVMHELAAEAMDLASNQESQADVIEEVSGEALDTSNEALNSIQNVTGLGAVEKQVQELETMYGLSQGSFDEALQMAEEVKGNAQDALDSANSLLAKARQPLMDIDVSDLSQSAADIMAEAERIIEAAKMISDQNKMLMMQVDTDSETARDLLDEGTSVQQDLDLLMALANKAESDAEEAKTSGDATLGEALEILSTLQSFNEDVEKSKERAQNASLKIDGIIANIDMANETALNAKDTIAAAEGDALEARKVANMARDNATAASEAAERTLGEATDELLAATQEKDRADDLAIDVNRTMMRLNAIEGQAINDSTAVAEAQRKANDAEKSSEQAMAAVTDALRQVNLLIDALDDLEEIDETVLDAAEENFNNLNNTYYADLNVHDIMTRMQEYEDQQNIAIAEHQLSLVEVTKQVQNIEEISASLPDFCPRLRKLEP